jgi:hypothetical protein
MKNKSNLALLRPLFQFVEIQQRYEIKMLGSKVFLLFCKNMKDEQSLKALSSETENVFKWHKIVNGLDFCASKSHETIPFG